MKNLLLLNGPNLNLLGEREPEIYGSTTLCDIEKEIGTLAAGKGIPFSAFQSNHEGELIDFIHENCSSGDGVIFNPGGFTHTSVALRDALLGREAVLVEVHISNVHARESFRRHSYFSDIAKGVIAGLGVNGYRYAFDFLAGGAF